MNSGLAIFILTLIFSFIFLIIMMYILTRKGDD